VGPDQFRTVAPRGLLRLVPAIATLVYLRKRVTFGEAPQAASSPPSLVVPASVLSLGGALLLIELLNTPGLADPSVSTNTSHQLIDQASIILAVPYLEEVIFRGGVLRLLLGTMRSRSALVLSAALFCATHILPTLYIGALVLGFITGALFLMTRRLRAPVSAHIVWNATPLIWNYFISHGPAEVIAYHRFVVLSVAMGLVALSSLSLARTMRRTRLLPES